MVGSRALAGAVVAQIVAIDAVDHRGDSAGARRVIEAGEQLVFAMEAAVAIVLDVVGIVELARLDVFVADPVFAGKRLGIALVRFGERCGIGSDRNGAVA